MKNRCCGRCDGINDICVADTTCEAHNVLGCELCFGPRHYFLNVDRDSENRMVIRLMPHEVEAVLACFVVQPSGNITYDTVATFILDQIKQNK